MTMGLVEVSNGYQGRNSDFIYSLAKSSHVPLKLIHSVQVNGQVL